MRLGLATLGLACAVTLAGCSSVLSGAGQVAQGGGGATTSPAPRPTACPHVVYPGAHLAFDCITGGLVAFYDGPVWPVSERKTVERSTQWVLEEGAGHWGSPEGASLADIADNVRQQMVSVGGYGAKPSMQTVADRATTVDGHPAHLLQTTFTMNPGWARKDGTQVKQEKLWIVAIQVGAGDVSLWYASVPDLVKSLWPKVPATIASIKVS